MGTKSKQQCATRACNVLMKLRKKNFDPELFAKLSEQRITNTNFRYLPNGEVKRDKNGRKVRIREYRPRVVAVLS
jgi:hypothetical protein